MVDQRKNTAYKAPNTQDSFCRRSSHERRQANLRSFVCLIFLKRRKALRRKEDFNKGIYTDWHEPASFAVVFSILLFCFLDAFFTMYILSIGGEELNPFMRILLEKDYYVFFYVKLFLTALCLMVLIAHRRFKLFRFLNGDNILYATFIGYFVLIFYEIRIILPNLN